MLQQTVKQNLKNYGGHMFDINYDSGLGKGPANVAQGIGGEVSIGVGYIVSACTDVYIQVGRDVQNAV